MEKATGLTTQNSGRITSLCVEGTQVCVGNGRVSTDKIGLWLKGRYEHDTAKLVARDLGASVRSVENWLSGSMPNAFWLLKMIVFYGPDFFGFISPWVPAWLNEARIAAEADELKQQAARIAARQQTLEQRAARGI